MSTELLENPEGFPQGGLPEAVEEAFQELELVTLKLSDRCDGPGVPGGVLRYCGAQAYVLTTFPESGHTLLWCAHHYNQFQYKLDGCFIHDERDRLQKESEAYSG